MIDSGELDWKAIAINVNDPLYDLLNSKDDVEQLLPGVISGNIDTTPLRVYKYNSTPLYEKQYFEAHPTV